MNTTLHFSPYRINPWRLYTTIAAVVIVHALALLWIVSDEPDPWQMSTEPGQVIMADIWTETPSPSPTPQVKLQTAAKPNSTPVKNSAKAEETASTTTQTSNTATAQPTATSTNLTAANVAKDSSSNVSVIEPSADADYLKNPPPAYPRTSRRLGEQGTVIVRVFITTQGLPEKAEVRSSSGFSRLDQAALEAVQHWRFVPGRRHGAPEAMWFNIPVRFVLE